MTCRFCHAPLEHLFADLGMSPLSNSYLRAEELSRMERFYPLAAYVCARCFLVQLPEFESPEAIFGDYAYFSSYSESWLAHAKAYCEAMRSRLALDERSLVIEIASNDGYLLQYFREAGVPVLGIEPAANVAAVAREKGIETLVQFFGVETARALPRKADLLLGNNVLAHVPDLNDFVAGMKIALAEGGTITMEFPHLLRLIEGNQFDTIYHEHFSYFSLLTVRQVFAKHGLTIVDVEELPTHGGSLRIYAKHEEAAIRSVDVAEHRPPERPDRVDVHRVDRELDALDGQGAISHGGNGLSTEVGGCRRDRAGQFEVALGQRAVGRFDRDQDRARAQVETDCRLIGRNGSFDEFGDQPPARAHGRNRDGGLQTAENQPPAEAGYGVGNGRAGQVCRHGAMMARATDSAAGSVGTAATPAQTTPNTH